jgi:hypothetical protein
VDISGELETLIYKASCPFALVSKKKKQCINSMNDVPKGGAEEDHNGAIVHGVVVDVEGEGGHTLVHQDTKVVTYFTFSIFFVGLGKKAGEKKRRPEIQGSTCVSIKFTVGFKHAIFSIFIRRAKTEGKGRQTVAQLLGGEAKGGRKRLREINYYLGRCQ